MQKTQELWVQSLGRENPLEEKMATHSSILAWKIRGQRRLACYMGLQRVRHNWTTEHSLTQREHNEQRLTFGCNARGPAFPHLFFGLLLRPLYNTISCQPVVFCFPLSMNPYCLQDAWFPAPVPISLLIASYLPAITVLCLKQTKQFFCHFNEVWGRSRFIYSTHHLYIYLICSYNFFLSILAIFLTSASSNPLQFFFEWQYSIPCPTVSMHQKLLLN